MRPQNVCVINMFISRSEMSFFSRLSPARVKPSGAGTVHTSGIHPHILMGFMLLNLYFSV